MVQACAITPGFYLGAEDMSLGPRDSMYVAGTKYPIKSSLMKERVHFWLTILTGSP